MESRSLVGNRGVDLPKTIWNISGLLTIGVFDISVFAGFVWVLLEYPIVQTVVIGILALLILIAVLVGLAFRLGRDEYDSR